MTEEMIANIVTNAPAWAMLFLVFREGMKSFATQQEHDREIIISLSDTIRQMASDCIGEREK